MLVPAFVVATVASFVENCSGMTFAKKVEVLRLFVFRSSSNSCNIATRTFCTDEEPTKDDTSVSKLG